jgi:hypothetical protein
MSKNLELQSPNKERSGQLVGASAHSVKLFPVLRAHIVDNHNPKLVRETTRYRRVIIHG